MKVYKRNLGLTLLSALMSAAAIALTLFIIYYFAPGSSESRVFTYAIVVSAVLFLLVFIPCLKEQVTVTENAFVLKGFRVKDVNSVNSGKKTPFGSQGSDPAKEIAVLYSDVVRLEIVRDILFWRQNLRITADGFYQPVNISNVMNSHKQLYAEIMNRVKAENADAFIDPKLIKYLK